MNVKCLKCSTNFVFLVIICVAGIPGRSFTVFGIHPHCTQWCRDIYPRNGSHLEADTDVVSIYFTMPGALRSKAWFCNRFLAGIVGSNPAGGIDICLLRMFFLSESSLRRADHSFRAVLSSVVCLSAIVNPR